MKIAWISEKRMDTAIDHATWTETTRLLLKNGHDITLHTGYWKSKENFDLGNHIQYLNSIKMAGLGLISVRWSIFVRLLWLAFIDKPEYIIIHPSSMSVAWPFALFRKIGLLKSRLILDIRTLPVEVRGLRAFIQNTEFSMALGWARFAFDAITVITPFMQKVLCERYGLEHKKMQWWSSGASESWLKANQPQQAMGSHLRSRLGLEGKYVCIYHGSMSGNRGLNDLVAAMAIVRQNQPDIHLVLLGNGSVRNDLERQACELKCQDSIHFLNAVPFEEVQLILQMADLGVVPLTDLLEWRVSSPIKLMEYLASGLPVVASDIEAHKDVLENQEFALYFQAGNPRKLAYALMQAYLNRDAAARHSQQAKAFIAKHYTWSIQAKRLELFLQNL